MNDNERDFRVTLEEFIEYYTNVSASIDDDMYFAAMMNSAWNLQGDAAQYKSYAKAWSGEQEAPKRPATASYQRVNKEPDGQPTIRSGLVSSDFPFGDSTAKYYQQKSPGKTSIANPKVGREQSNYNQITGQESNANPFVSAIGTEYNKHIQTTQKE